MRARESSIEFCNLCSKKIDHKKEGVCYSAKFNCIFCGHKCYVEYRKRLDPVWKDEPIYQSEKEQ